MKASGNILVVAVGIALALGIYPWRHVVKLLPLNAMKR